MIKKNTPTPVSATVIISAALDPTRMPTWKTNYKPNPEERGARTRRTVAISNLFGIIFSLDYECTEKNKGLVATQWGGCTCGGADGVGISP
jgi:hypothetical protein